MASTALDKAITKLERQENRKKKERIESRHQMSTLAASGSATVASAGAGVLDKRFGRGGDVAKWGDTNVPINLTVGPPALIASMFMPKGMIRDIVGGAGFGLTLAAGYRLAHDNTPDPDDD